MRERRRTYELMYIISPLRNGEEEITASIDRVQQSISGLGGEVISTDQTSPWGRRKFAYPIREYAEGEASRRSFTEGYYVLSLLTLPAEQVAELERSLRLNDAVLRYLLTTVDPKNLAAGSAAAVALAGAADEGDEGDEGDEDEGDEGDEEDEDEGE